MLLKIQKFDTQSYLKGTIFGIEHSTSEADCKNKKPF